MNTHAHAGRGGKDVRSDCRIAIERTPGSGRAIELQSKVGVLYGTSIRALIGDMLAFYALDDVTVRIDDSGALPYTLAARMEAAVRRLDPAEQRQYLLPARDGLETRSARDRFRRSRLYLPGNDPKLAINAGIHAPDAIILDLEDSVSPEEKDTARILVRNSLRTVNFYGAERMVRINQLPMGRTDLAMIVPARPQLILVPKCEHASQITEVNEAIADAQRESGFTDEIHLMPIIESALGAMHALEIATAAPNVVALAIGLEDYTADLGAERTLEGRESQWMRGVVVNAARAAGIQAIDTVFSDVNDMEGLLASAREARSLGFDGKGCIHPRQIPVVHAAFNPPAAEIERAQKIVRAFEDAERRGLGVVALGSKMIDPPVVKRAQRTIDMAVRAGLIPADWNTEVQNG